MISLSPITAAVQFDGVCVALIVLRPLLALDYRALDYRALDCGAFDDCSRHRVFYTPEGGRFQIVRLFCDPKGEKDAPASVAPPESGLWAGAKKDNDSILSCSALDSWQLRVAIVSTFERLQQLFHLNT
jgi:hypothetical protein